MLRKKCWVNSIQLLNYVQAVSLRIWTVAPGCIQYWQACIPIFYLVNLNILLQSPLFRSLRNVYLSANWGSIRKILVFCQLKARNLSFLCLFVFGGW